LAGALTDFATSAITDFKNIEDAAKQLIATLAKLAIQKGLEALFNSAIPGGFKLSALGGAYSQGVQKFARGTVVGQPTLFGYAGGTGLMGEAGPEAIMPLQRNASGQLGVAAPPVNVTVNNLAGAQVSVQDHGQGNIEIIIERTRAALAADVRQGGNNFARAMERTYGVARSAGAFG
jgi:lambda family phage tail tape measure protein